MKRGSTEGLGAPDEAAVLDSVHAPCQSPHHRDSEPYCDTQAESDPTVSQVRWAIMMRACLLISSTKYTFSWDVSIMGESVHLRGQGLHGISLYLCSVLLF